MLQTTIQFERGSHEINVTVCQGDTMLLNGTGFFYAEDGEFSVVDGYDNGLIEAAGELLGPTGDTRTEDEIIDLAEQVVAFLAQRDNETWDSPQVLVKEAQKHPIPWH